MVEAPARPALRWHGVKWNLAPWIVSHMPKTHNYLEPFLGSAAVLLRKPRSPLEHACELDARVTQFFEVLRTRPDELIQLLLLTPWSREEFGRSFDLSGDALEDARRFFVRSWQGVGSLQSAHRSSWRFIKDVEKSYKSPAHYWTFEHLLTVADRLQGVQLDNRSAFVVIPKFNRDNVLIYADPPYVMSTRRRSDHQYMTELEDAEHETLLALLKEHSGPVLLSGYPSELYSDLLPDWQVFTKDVTVNSRGYGATEALYLSPRTIDALKSGLFGGLATL